MTDLAHTDVTDVEEMLLCWRELGKEARRMNSNWCPSLLLPEEQQAWLSGWSDEDKALRNG